jgi:hypothetical protein
MVFNATYNNISVISWWSLFGEKNRSTRWKPPTRRKSLTNSWSIQFRLDMQWVWCYVCVVCCVLCAATHREKNVNMYRRYEYEHYIFNFKIYRMSTVFCLKLCYWENETIKLKEHIW